VVLRGGGTGMFVCNGAVSGKQNKQESQWPAQYSDRAAQWWAR
jgi:hypothetical protein